jgi:hypothetical protein
LAVGAVLKSNVILFILGAEACTSTTSYGEEAFLTTVTTLLVPKL